MVKKNMICGIESATKGEINIKVINISSMTDLPIFIFRFQGMANRLLHLLFFLDCNELI